MCLKFAYLKHTNLPNIHDLKVAPTDILLEINEKPFFASENEFEKGSKLIERQSKLLRCMTRPYTHYIKYKDAPILANNYILIYYT